ncbi:hypothetical protein [Pseudidiomarina aestuarii]|uniref:hypothetical protein n=1 Tax=Pseudidiomarina aestuarii TaxID=624146 RepID=UPI003A96FD82
MDANEIKNQLYQNDFDLQMLADVLNCSSSLVSKVIHRKARSQRVARAIAKSISLNVYDVFPELEGSKTMNKTLRKSKLEELRLLLSQD